MSTSKYTPAEDADAIAIELIDTIETHANLKHVTVRCFITALSKEWGKAKKASPLEYHLSGADFIILLDGEWNRMEPEMQRGLIDHELCHCVVKTEFKNVTVTDVNGAPVMGDNNLPRTILKEVPERDEYRRVKTRLRDHDVEEFAEVVERHGLWRGSLRRFADASKQLELELGLDSADGTNAAPLHRVPVVGGTWSEPQSPLEARDGS